MQRLNTPPPSADIRKPKLRAKKLPNFLKNLSCGFGVEIGWSPSSDCIFARQAGVQEERALNCAQRIRERKRWNHREAAQNDSELLVRDAALAHEVDRILGLARAGGF